MRKTGLPRRAVVLALLGLVVASATAVTLIRRPDTPVATAAPAHDVLATLPISFEPADGGFVSRGTGYSLDLTPAGAVVGVAGGRFALRPAGPLANPAAELVAADPLGATVSRITGTDPTHWRTGTPTFARVAARQVWPGVDMVWHGDQRRLEHDMVVAAGVDPAVVAFEVDGAGSLTVDAAGDLVLGLDPDGSTARLAKPVLYQEVAGARRPVDGGFAVLGPSRVGFTVGAYDRSLPLVIDPTLQTSTLLGGAGPDAGYAIAVDTQGNTYVAGTTESGDFPTSEPLQKSLSGAAGTPSADVFVSKISPDGSKLIWSTYLGGAGRDTGFAVAVGGDGTVYVSGVTESADFPVARGAQTSYGGGTSDGFVARIAANGAGIEWSSFIGGSGTDRARGLAVDSTGNAYLTGSTNSDNFPSVNAQQPGPFRAEDLDAFVAKFPAGGAPLTFSTRLGGGNEDRGLAIAVDTQGAVYVTGDTLSPGFPTVRPIQASSGSSAGGAGAFTDAFVAKYNPTGTALVYSTFLGGSDFDQGTAIAVDGQGAAYVAGNTNSANFPTAGALQAAKSNDPDAFVTKIDPAGGALVYSTYLGGNGADGANGIAVDRAGSAHVVGTTGSANFVSNKATQLAKAGGDDAFVVKLDSTGRGPLFATFLGGRDTDAGMGVALTSQGGVRVLGLTGSADFPSVKPVQGAKPPAAGDAFVAALELTDPAAPATTAVTSAPAGSGASAQSDEAHDRRVRTFGLIFLVLLVAAIAQTAYLRRRTPAPVPARGAGGRPPSRPPTKARPAGKAAPAAKAAPARKAAPAAKAEAGLKVLDRTSPGAVAAGPSSPPAAKAGGGQRGTSAQKKAAASRKAAERRARKEAAAAAAAAAATEVVPATDVAPAPPVATAAAPAVALGVPADRVENAEDGGPPTMATPAAPPPPAPPKATPPVPAIAALLEEDLWAPAPSEATGDEADDTQRAPAAAPQETPPAPEWAPFDTGSVPVVGDDAPAPPPPSPPGVPIPPVPAAELSFWDLFPEDLPPARPTFPADDVVVEDIVVEPLALPEGPGSAAERLARPDADPGPAEHVGEVDPLQVASPEQERPPHPPEAEIVIAELLDGPPPTGTRMSAESQWAPRPDEDDMFINDLLVQPPESPRPAPAGGDEGPDATDDDSAIDLAAATRRANPDQARIAADRARRRRSRRGGGRGNQPGSG